MSLGQLTALLEPRVERGSRNLLHLVWTFLAVQMATLILGGANLVGYRSNPVMLAVEAGVVLAALGFAAYGVNLHGKVRRLERMDETLESALRRRLAFFSSYASTWMWIAAFSLVVFTFALNSLIDNADGNYPINKPAVFVGVQVAMVLGLVVSFYLAQEPRSRELRAVLADLEAQVVDRTEAVDRELERGRRWRMLLAILLTAALALGAWVAWRGGF